MDADDRSSWFDGHTGFLEGDVVHAFDQQRQKMIEMMSHRDIRMCYVFAMDKEGNAFEGAVIPPLADSEGKAMTHLGEQFLTELVIVAANSLSQYRGDIARSLKEREGDEAGEGP